MNERTLPQMYSQLNKSSSPARRTLSALVLTVAVLLIPALAQAGNVTMTANDGFGASSLTGAGKWSDLLAPHAGANYFSSTYYIRTPPDSGNVTYTFAGDSLTLQQPASGNARSLMVKSGNNDTFVINNLTNAFGGILENGGAGNEVETFTGNLWTIAANSAVMGDQGSVIIGYPLSGADGIILTNGGGNANGITYNGNNSAFTGKFYITKANFGNGGGNTTMKLNAANSLPGNPSVSTPDQFLIESGCTLQDNIGLTMNNANGGITLRGTGSSTINAAATTTISEPITDKTNGIVSSVATLVKAGTGTLVLNSANNSWSGGTTISAGTLKIGIANALPAVNLANNGGTLDLNGISTTIGALSGTSGTIDTVAGGTPTLTVGANNNGGSYSGGIQNSSGTLSLTKVGTGTQILAGGYSYSGTTLVAGGTLALSTAVTLPTTPGDLIVSNGAVVTVDASGGAALPVNNLTVGANSSLSFTLNSSAVAANVAGSLTFLDNATNNFSYGTITANPTAAEVLNVTGGVVVSGTNIVLNVTGIGFQPGTFTLIKYTGTPLADIANFTLTTTPGVLATLVNNTGNDSIDINVSSVSRQVTWYGASGTTWDINTTANWYTNNSAAPATVYLQYTNGSSVVGDGVTFDDTLTNSIPQPTNITLADVVSPYPITFNSSLPYSLSGAGGLAGSSSLVKNNSGSLTLLTSNSFTGGVVINGGVIVITNDSALGATGVGVVLNGGGLQLNGDASSARPISVSAASSIGVTAGATAQLSGSLIGAAAMSKVDNGTLTLSGSNSLTGSLSVNQGALTLSPTVSNNYPAEMFVGTTGPNGILQITSGTVNASRGSAPSIDVGDAGGSGSLQVSGGNLSLSSELWLATGDGGYGALTMNGGNVYIGSWMAFGRGGGQGILNMNNGTLTIGANNLTLGSFGGTTTYPFWHGVANISGGTVSVTNGNVYVGENTSGTLNMLGGALNIAGSLGLRLGHINSSLSSGIANLIGGTVTTPAVSKGSGSGTVNFNGGTVKASAANTAFMTGLNAANIFANGATIDDGGFAITVAQPLLAPTGYGVSSVSLSSGGSGYVDTPIVTLSGGTGSGATAIATVSGGVVTGVTVTSPGTGYASSDTLSVIFSGGGGSGAGANTPVLAANVSGGLTKNGTGTLALTGTNNFGGDTAVNAGTLQFTTPSVPHGKLVVADAAVASVTQIGGGTNAIADLTLNGSGSVPGGTLGLALTYANNPNIAVLNCGTLTLNGANSISLAGSVPVGTIKLIRALGAIAGAGSITNLILPQGASGSITTSFDGTYSTVSAVITSTGPGLTWAGTNSLAPNVWNINITTNWLLGTTPTVYEQIVVPGDAVTFDDSGSGTVLLNTNAAPASFTISNNTTAYSFSGKGTVSGSTGLLKLGSGTATLNLTNNTYLGDTVISNGTLQIGVASAVSSSANLTVGATGTFEVAGTSPTVTELTGAGIVDNNNGTPSILTVGNSTGGTWNGTITNTGGGGVALHKVGSGTWVIGGANYLNDAQPFTDRDSINGGTVIITNGGLLSVSDLELRIADGGSITSAVVVAGGTLIVTNNPLSIGLNATNANGTLIVNSGTVIAGTGGAGAFAGSPNNIVVGANNATGTLIINGGQVISTHDLWLGQNSGANATLYLNGGLLQAAQIGASGTPVTSVAYFNGGTLQAATNSASFISLPTFARIQSNGLTLDDNGFTLTFSSTGLAEDGASPGGGLVKKGAGTVYLNVANNYTGLTLVTNGTLAGTGQIDSPVLVAPAGNIAAGDGTATLGTFSLNYTTPHSLTIQGEATLRISKNGGTPASDLITGIDAANYGGTLVVSNATTDATPLQVGDSFTLFSANSYSGNFTNIAGSPGSGLAYSFNPTNGVLSVVGTIASNPTNITFSVSGSTLSLSWPSDHLGWILQAQTNSLSTGLGTNWFDIPDSASTTSTNLTIDPLNGSVFYRLRKP